MTAFTEIAGPAIGAGIGLGGDILAADAIGDASGDALDLQRQIFNQLIELQEPFRRTGARASNRLRKILFEGANFKTDPGFKFRRKEGIKALDRSAASRGNLFSGSQGKAITRFGQNFASNEFSNVINRLAGVAGLGQAANTQIVPAANQLSAGGSAALAQQGAGRASGFAGGANILNDFIAGLN